MKSGLAAHYAALLRRCINANDLWAAKRIHAEIQRSSNEQDRFLANLLVQIYGNFGDLGEASIVFESIRDKNVFSWTLMIEAYGRHYSYLEYARTLFDLMPNKDGVSWNAMISVYVRHDLGTEALILFKQMQEQCVAPGKVTVISALSACSSNPCLIQGKQIHVLVIQEAFRLEVVLGTALIHMYGKCGSVADACSVFHRMSERNLVTWNAILSVYVQSGDAKEALSLFSQMQHQGFPLDKFTFVTMFCACASKIFMAEGKRVHCFMLETGVQLDDETGIGLISMYGKCGSLQYARAAFEKVPEPNVISWNAITAAYLQHEDAQEVLFLFEEMRNKKIVPDRGMLIKGLSACCSHEDLAVGRLLHAIILNEGLGSDVGLGNALVIMYGNCGGQEDACAMFGKLLEKDVISWTSMMTVYIQQGHGKEAIKLFNQMFLEGVMPDKITLVTIITACTILPSMSDGKHVHTRILSRGFELDIVVGTALVNMYGKWGSLNDAWGAFCNILKRDVCLWNAMIGNYAQWGNGKMCLELFHLMEIDGELPDLITLISLLMGCSHAGLLVEGNHYFLSMSQHYTIEAVPDHYHCILDLLGRAGWLDEAEDLVENIMFQHSKISWLTLLGACTMRGDLDRGERAAKLVSDLDPDDPAPYILLSNLYAYKHGWPGKGIT